MREYISVPGGTGYVPEICRHLEPGLDVGNRRYRGRITDWGKLGVNPV